MITRRKYFRRLHCRDDTSSNATDRRNNQSDSPESHSEEPPDAPVLEPLAETALEALSPLERTTLERLEECRRGDKNWINRFWFVCLFVCGCCWLLSGFLHPPAASRQLHRFLKGLDLERYEQTLLSNGYDRLEDLLWATEADLIDAGVTIRPHRVRILRRGTSMQSGEGQWIVWSVLCLMCWTTMGAMVLVFAWIRHEGFRSRCWSVMAWTAITLWARWRIYKRCWNELKEKNRSHPDADLRFHLSAS